MGLTSPLLVVIAAGLALGLAVLIAVTRTRRPRGWLGHGARFVAILLSQAMAVGAVVLVANNTYDFYNNWADLLGTKGGSVPVVTAAGLVPPDGSEGRILTLTVQVPGAKGPEGERLPVLVWVPKQYDQKQFAKTQFPVLMMLTGQPSTPQGVFSGFVLGRAAQTAIDSGQVKPFVMVLPPLMIDPPRDTECTNVPNGPQAETWLFDNVRTAVIKKVRVDKLSTHWSSMGWSTGAFCSAKLLLRHRNLFNAAVGIGGYYTAETDNTTGDLFARNGQLRRENSPSWLIKQTGAVQTNLLVVTSEADKDSWVGAPYADTAKFVNDTKGTPGLETIILKTGGHNFGTYKPTLPAIFAWLQRTGSFG